MSDRCSATITIGGRLSHETYLCLARAIADENLSIDWDGPWFQPWDRIAGQPLRLMAHDVLGGQFAELEAFCVAERLPFARWRGAYAGSCAAERVVFTGVGEPRSYIADEDDRILVDAGTIAEIGSLDALAAYFSAAEFIVPALVVSNP